MRGDARILQSKKDAGEFEGFNLLSIVKETGVDDEGLNEFATEYFPHPTYRDQSLVFYNALGSGKLSIGFNPFAMIQLIRDSMKRIKELGVKNYNTKGMCCGHMSSWARSCCIGNILFVSAISAYLGEGFLQGGWILFDREGNPKAAFQENAKKRVPIDDILKEVQSMRSSNTE